jgi:hypothetical protein
MRELGVSEAGLAEKPATCAKVPFTKVAEDTNKKANGEGAVA